MTSRPSAHSAAPSHQLLADALRQLDARGLVVLQMGAVDAFSLLGFLQFTLCLPCGRRMDSSDAIRSIARELQRVIALSGPLAELVEAGWDQTRRRTCGDVDGERERLARHGIEYR